MSKNISSPFGCLAALAAVVLISGCTVTTTTATSSTTATTAVTTTPAVAPPVAPTSTPEETTPPAATTPTQPTSETTKAAIMPNVVCMNLQDAQNKIQEAGVFFSRSSDASGQGRSQLVDSNWIVVSQTPAPGSPVTEGQAVLSAVKIGEPNSCG